MAIKIDFEIASSTQIETELCNQLRAVRLMKNITQSELARDAGISLRTVVRLEQGLGVSLDSFIRVMMALGIQRNLAVLLPDASVRPMDRVRLMGRERLRARPRKPKTAKKPWVWNE